LHPNMFRQLFHKPTATLLTQHQSQRTIFLTNPNFAEPLRKKKVVDPQTTKKQFERKVRKLEKAIKTLESQDPKLKPILEMQLPPQVKKELDVRKRQETDEMGHKMLKAYLRVWSIYKSLESEKEIKAIQTAASAQEKALDVLKRDYPDLYNAAIQLDPNLIPYTVNNVKKDTPPADSYTCPDGKEYDTTKAWRL